MRQPWALVLSECVMTRFIGHTVVGNGIGGLLFDLRTPCSGSRRAFCLSYAYHHVLRHIFPALHIFTVSIRPSKPEGDRALNLFDILECMPGGESAFFTTVSSQILSKKLVIFSKMDLVSLAYGLPLRSPRMFGMLKATQVDLKGPAMRRSISGSAMIC